MYVGNIAIIYKYFTMRRGYTQRVRDRMRARAREAAGS